MTTHAITLATRDGQTLNFTAAPDQDLLSAAEAAGLRLPSLCRDGGCGACTCTAAAGDYRLGEYSPAALPDAARDRGEVLLCRAYAASDMTLRAPYGADRVRYDAAATRTAEILALDEVADRTVRLLLRLGPDASGGTMLEYEPGQYVCLGIPGGLARPYSIANPPDWSGELEFFIRLHDQGRFSRFLRDEARVGGALEVGEPLGEFTLRAESLRPRWLVGGGTGLAPLLAMLRRMAELGDSQPARLYFGVTRARELFAGDALAELARELPQLRVTRCVWHPEPGWEGFAGTAADALRRDLAEVGAQPDLYLCGPPGLVDAVQAAARAAGLTDGQVHSERF